MEKENHKTTKEDAEMLCKGCDMEIGYETSFVKLALTDKYEWWHTICLDKHRA